MLNQHLVIDVHRNQVADLTAWFEENNLVEGEVVEQSGWLGGNYRVLFYPDHREAAMLFKLTFAGVA